MRDAWELASFVVTALGLPFAIAFFMWEERKERDNEEAGPLRRSSAFLPSFPTAVKPAD